MYQRKRALRAASLLGLVWIAGAGVAGAGVVGEPQALSPVERRAAQLAANYLAGGPAAWWPELARGSWLRRLGHDAAVAEIEVRAGLPAGSRWTLEAATPGFAERGAAFSIAFPSGIDDTLLLGLVAEDGTLKIDSIRTAAEVYPSRPEGAGGDPDVTPSGAAAQVWWRPEDPLPWAAGLGLSGLLALLAGGKMARRRPAPRQTSAGSFVMMAPEPHVGWGRALLVVGVGLVGLGIGGLALFVQARRAPAVAAGGQEATAEAAAAAGSPPEHSELRALLPLRREATTTTVATAAAPAAVERVAGVANAAAAAPPAGRVGAEVNAVAAVWRAQLRSGQGDLAGAATLLKGLPAARTPALAFLLRARLALERLQELETAVNYEHALDLGLAHEAILSEASDALYILGFEDTSKRYANLLMAIGARNAAPYYDMAERALLLDHEAESHERFATGWRLQPMPRADLLEDSVSAYLLLDRNLRRLVSLDTYAEPLAPCGRPADHPLTLPAGVSAHVLGETLRLTAEAAGAGAGEENVANGGEVLVPGGCDLAPAGSQRDGAMVWQREREAVLLRRLPALKRSGALAGTWVQPVPRHEAEEAAAALAGRQRWSDLADITAGLSLPDAVLPPHIAHWRALALTRLNRKDEARQLLVRLVMGDKLSQRKDPAALYQLATLLEDAGDFDSAIRLVHKADGQLPRPSDGGRILQLQTEKRLAASAATTKTAHCVISYPLARGKEYGELAGRILEAEYKRLQSWIPVSGGPPIDVRLLPFEDFLRAFSEGGDVLGLFDGVVRLPLGEVSRWSPFAVSIMTHELAHAMIAQRTSDRAPHWFQEGLAQHVEMQEEARVNPIAEYRVSERLLPFPLLEPALRSYASAAWTLASYDEALWTINFIEAKHGVAALHRLMDAFAGGQDTEEAIASVFHESDQQFDHELWEWCTTAAPHAWQMGLTRYDGYRDAHMMTERRGPRHIGRRGADG